MPNTSSAVAQNWVSEVLGYSLQKGNFSPSNPNMPIRIAIIGEANHANQSSFTANIAQELTSSAQAASIYGYGSPIHLISLILFPSTGSNVNATVVSYPLAEAGAAQVKTITVAGATTSSSTGTIYLNVAGRNNYEGYSMAISVTSGDSRATVASAINAALNANLFAPSTGGVSSNMVTATAKWYGLTSNDITYTITDDIKTGFTFTVATVTAGSGSPTIDTALSNFGSNWNNIVINGLNTNTASLVALNTYNGRPDTLNPTGRFTGIVMKPFIAFCGSVSNDPTSITDTYHDDLTIDIAYAPYSQGLPFEAAANKAYLWANVLSSTPHLDISGIPYPNMPLPLSTNIPATQNAATRDAYVKLGCSTVNIINGAYVNVDSVTTYHPDGENPPIFRYTRDILGIDMNIKYGWYLIIAQYIVNHVICNDNDTVTAENIIKPKQVKGLIATYANDLAARALIADPQFMANSAQCTININNPQRLDISFSYKRTGDGRIVATTVTAGFNFGV